jgi:hypothetical protein
MSGSFDYTNGIAVANPSIAPTWTATYSAWVKPNVAVTSDAIIMGAGEAAAEVNMHRLEALANGTVAATVRSGLGINRVASTSTLSTSAWTLVTGKFSSDTPRHAEVFVNGGSENYTENSARFITGNEVFAIGALFQGGRNFPGLITNVAIWGSNVNLSDTEIAALQAGADPLTLSAIPLVAYFDGTTFDVTGTTMLQDMSGNANHLTISGAVASADEPTFGPDYTQRKGSTFDVPHGLGTITTATLNAAAITINTTGAGTVNLTDTSGITTSGVYNLVLGDGAATETYTVQVNVFGVVPSNNPAQKDGAALASLTGIQIRITAGANLNGTQVYYSGTETTNASGNFSTLDVSTSAAVAADPVRMQVLTAAGDSITSAETVGLI